MIHSGRFTVFLDACVLYPAAVTDILLSLATEGLFKPKWSDIVQYEWTRNVLESREDLTKAQLQHRVDAMNLAFPDATIENFEDLIEVIELPDPDDRHVIAAGIKEKVDVIITFNIKDFPQKVAKKFDIEIQHPDTLISNLIDLNQEKACKALKKMLARLKNPPRSKKDILEMLAKCDLKESAELLKTGC